LRTCSAQQISAFRSQDSCTACSGHRCVEELLSPSASPADDGRYGATPSPMPLTSSMAASPAARWSVRFAFAKLSRHTLAPARRARGSQLKTKGDNARKGAVKKRTQLATKMGREPVGAANQGSLTFDRSSKELARSSNPSAGDPGAACTLTVPQVYNSGRASVTKGLAVVTGTGFDEGSGTAAFPRSSRQT
jgi:hypothetical protein